jgi:hypothetical protein
MIASLMPLKRGMESIRSRKWEADDHFLSKENYPGLVKLRERRLARRPDELDTQIGVGEAYILNGEYDKALAWLSGLHRKVPDHPDIQHLVLDTLFATEKTEDDFPWVEKPTVVRLSGAVLDQCAEALKGKRKPRSAAGKIDRPRWLAATGRPRGCVLPAHRG